MIAALGREVSELDPEVLVVSQLRAAPYVEFAAGASLWLDQADVWSLFLNQEVAARRGLPRFTSKLQLAQIRQAERLWGERASAISTAGYGDQQYLEGITDMPVEWLPTAITPREIPRAGGEGRTAGFLANFAFWPNRDAFEVLRDHWAPTLRRMGWKTVVAGIGSEQLDGRGQIEIVGQVGDLAEYYSRIDASLAPIRLGGGVKVKIIEALMYERPVFASAYALEGFPPDLAASIPVVSELEPSFDTSLIEGTAPEEAFALALKYFSPEAWDDTVKRLLDVATARGAR